MDSSQRLPRCGRPGLAGERSESHFDQMNDESCEISQKTSKIPRRRSSSPNARAQRSPVITPPQFCPSPDISRSDITIENICPLVREG